MEIKLKQAEPRIAMQAMIPCRDRQLLTAVGAGNPALGLRHFLREMRPLLEENFGRLASRMANQKKVEQQNKQEE